MVVVVEVEEEGKRKIVFRGRKRSSSSLNMHDLRTKNQ